MLDAAKSLHVHLFCFFFFNDTATTEIYTLSLHDALPICISRPDPLKLRPIRVGADRVDQAIPMAERLEIRRRRDVRPFLARGVELLAEFLQRVQKARLLRQCKADWSRMRRPRWRRLVDRG